ncbi:DNA-3-methyladenine glycosylase [Corynebacterium otitidis]|uniref:DNA-3-methyladenine glycosylase n=1 Tax=Corynebacterium otitidis TaxID=29321 RepID=UPI000627AD6E|nr:DNA-3-methyladenine glycosylase [Corynebacterium otitidis]KKO83746.1 3-methyladenine DNA glycosylase [Corynebacterium otitidis]
MILAGIDLGQPADRVAPQLLGCVLRLGPVAVRLTEVEAYLSSGDPAAHSHRGRTRANAQLFGPAGRLYVYISYGIHRAGNVVCGPEGTGQGCLLRGGEIVGGLAAARRRRGDVPDERLARGPGNLGRALGLTTDLNGEPLDGSGAAGLELRAREAEPEWVQGPRIGISKNTEAPLRFWLPGDPTVSSPRTRRAAV